MVHTGILGCVRKFPMWHLPSIPEAEVLLDGSVVTWGDSPAVQDRVGQQAIRNSARLFEGQVFEVTCLQQRHYRVPASRHNLHVVHLQS